MKNQAYEKVFAKMDQKKRGNGVGEINDIRDRFSMQQKYLSI